MPKTIQVIVLTALWTRAAVWALQSPAQVPAIGSPTRPPSSYSQGTVAVSAESTISGNLLVTGNVGGGKHLQSSTPYTDTSRLQTILSTTTLDSFYRQAATSYQRPQYDVGVVPFYSSSATTARTQVSQPAPSSPMQTRVGVMSQPMPQTYHVGPLDLPYTALPPQVHINAPVSKFWQETAARVQRDYQTEVPQEVWERLLRELAVPDQQDTVDNTLPLKPTLAGKPSALDREQTAPAEDPAETAFFEAAAESTPGDRLPDRLTREPLPEPNALAVLSSTQPVTAAAQRWEAAPGIMEEIRRSRFAAWMAMGEAYLKKAAYTQAVDAYTLAAQYEREHPRALAGKSFALLALGEYTRSALFLGRTLSAMPDYAEYPSILLLMLGEPRVRTCIRALQGKTVDSPAPELLFLLGYLHYQVGDLVLARQLLLTAQASGKTPPGLDPLLSVVEARLASGAG